MRHLAATGIPAVVSLEVLGLSRSPFYRWLEQPVTDSELAEAYVANAIFDAHRDDPEFGYRFLFDEVTAAGHVVSERTVWKITPEDAARLVAAEIVEGRRTELGREVEALVAEEGADD